MKLKKVACLGLAAMVALGALGCGSDNKAADNKAGSKVTGSVTGSGSSALLPLAKDAASKFKAINPDVSITLNGGGSGTAAGFGALCEGQTVDYCVERMGGILCHGSNGSSCPDQSAKALAAAKGLIDGTLCDNCGAAE